MNWLELRKTQFEADRLAALRAIDTSENWFEARMILRAYFQKYGAAIPESDEALLAAAHNERLRTKEMSLEERSASRAWLRDRGHDIS